MRRLLAASTGALLALSLATGVLGWGDLTLRAECAPDEATFAWTIDLPTENNFNIDWSFEADFSTFTTVDFGSAGEHQFSTPRGGDTLYVRWSSDHDTTAQAAANEELCEDTSPTPTPSSSASGSESQSASPTPTPSSSASGSESASPSPTPSSSASGSESASPSPTPTPTPTPTATPTTESSVQGGTPTSTPTTEGSVQGGNPTPEASQPDTATGAQGGPSPVPTAVFALILLAALGTLAWANAKTARNRS